MRFGFQSCPPGCRRRDKKGTVRIVSHLPDVFASETPGRHRSVVVPNPRKSARKHASSVSAAAGLAAWFEPLPGKVAAAIEPVSAKLSAVVEPVSDPVVSRVVGVPRAGGCTHSVCQAPASGPACGRHPAPRHCRGRVSRSGAMGFRALRADERGRSVAESCRPSQCEPQPAGLSATPRRPVGFIGNEQRRELARIQLDARGLVGRACVAASSVAGELATAAAGLGRRTCTVGLACRLGFTQGDRHSRGACSPLTSARPPQKTGSRRRVV